MPSTDSSARLPAGLRFVGHAIVSADGMISAGDGSMPTALRNDADWRLFQQALNQSALVVLGRLGHTVHVNPGRRRLVFTGAVAGLATDPGDANALLYNPAGAPLAVAMEHLNVSEGTVAVTGGTRVFDFFLPLYDEFILAEANALVLPDGRQTFAAGHPRAVLAHAGLVPGPLELLDPALSVTRTIWRRVETGQS